MKRERTRGQANDRNLDLGRLASDIVRQLEAHGDPRNVEGMARYGIRSAHAFGVTAPVIQQIARAFPVSHRLAARLWRTGILEARAIAALVDDPALVDDRQMERWVSDFDSWAICDTVCGRLFDRTPRAWNKARAWARRREEYVRRAGFVLMACLAAHDKQAADDRFIAFFPLIERTAFDERNMVKKAVNWALRQIGKRNSRLNGLAVECGERIRRHAGLRPRAGGTRGPSAARWIAADALRELRSAPVQARLAARTTAPATR